MTAGRTIDDAGASRFRGDIQGLRAVAVGAVVLYHAGVPFLGGGFVGVDVFFVISGFLITTHLLEQLDRHGRVRFGEFYARRARRILPASFTVLALSVTSALIWYPPLLMDEVRRGAIAAALFVPNLLFAVDGTDYLASEAPSLFQQYWSLGVEEQFYVVWPALLAVAWALRRSRRAVAVAVGVVVAASFAMCLVLTVQSPSWAFFSLWSRAWELGVGGLIAFGMRRPRWTPGAPAAAVVGWLGLAAVVAAAVLLGHGTTYPGVWAAVPVLGTAAVILSGATPGRLGPGRMLSTRGMVFVGTISYSLYLVHWPALMMPQAAGVDLPLVASIGIALACVPVAWLLHRCVEEPGRRWRLLVAARPRRTLVAATVATAMCVAGVSGAAAAAEGRELSVAAEAPVTTIEDPPDATAFVPANLRPSLRDADESLPVLFRDGCNRDRASTDAQGCVYGDPEVPRIVLFGDSHAAQWFPAVEAVARQGGYAVEVQTKSSCPAADLSVLRGGAAYPECDTWRAGVIARLRHDPPALVLVSGYGAAELPADVADDVATWDAALGATLDAISAPTAVLADTPDLREAPSTCLSMNLSDAAECAQQRSIALDGAAREAEVTATRAREVPLIDLNDYFCTATSCPPIIGNTLVYRDSHHMTAEFSAHLAPALADALRALLAEPAT